MRNPLFRWVEGFHKTGYSILTLAWVTRKWSPIPFDCYIIKYPPGAHIPPHKDNAVKNKRHIRINVVLTHPKGGEFVCENTIFRSKWLNVFRPDLETHSVTPTIGGTRYVFSVGCVI